MRNAPSASETAEWRNPLSRLRAVTVAPATGLPPSSRTRPATEPAGAWPVSAAASIHRASATPATAASPNVLFFLIPTSSARRAPGASRGADDGGVYRLHDCPNVQWFADVRRRAALQGARPRLRRIVAGDDHHGNVETRSRQPGLHVEAADLRHVQIEHDAVGPPRRERGQEVLAAAVGLGLEAERADQPRERAPHRFVVIHHRDEAFPPSGGHASDASSGNMRARLDLGPSDDLAAGEPDLGRATLRAVRNSDELGDRRDAE